MSKEAVGQINTKIGSSEYWSKVNRNTILGGLMGAKTSYQATLRELGQRASGTIEEIYTDLSSLGSRIRFLDSSNRNALAKQVEGLYDVCKMSGVTVWHNSECVQGLNLSMMSPWTRNFRDERGIQNAIATINKSRYSGREVVDLLKDAAKWGIAFACGSDRAKRAFLEAVIQGNNSSSFLQDVIDEYQGLDRNQRYEGKCGHTVGSRTYMTHMEWQVFGMALPSLICASSGNPDYERLLRDALRSVAGQLERDLDSAIRENDYITDETAAILKAVVSELDHCGVSTGSLNSKIEKLAWFVGGDPSKIKELQKALNDLGVGQHLKEDGVYGPKTETAVDKAINEISNFLTDKKKIGALSTTIDALVAVRNCLPHQRWKQEVYSVLEKGRDILQRTLWKSLAVDWFLPKKECPVAALLLEHSLEKVPSNLHFSQSHWVTEKVMQSNGFKKKFAELERSIQKNPDVYAVNGRLDMNFQESRDTDLYYGIGKCTILYNCIRHAASVHVKFFIEDRYDFDHIRTIRGDVERFIIIDPDVGPLANDFGLISQADGVISNYHIFITFEKTIDLN